MQTKNFAAGAVHLDDLPVVRFNRQPDGDAFRRFKAYFSKRRGQTVPARIQRPGGFTAWIVTEDAGGETVHSCEDVSAATARDALVMMLVDHDEVQRQGADVLADLAARGWFVVLSDQKWRAEVQKADDAKAAGDAPEDPPAA